jgi:hypothetical protein
MPPLSLSLSDVSCPVISEVDKEFPNNLRKIIVAS